MANLLVAQILESVTQTMDGASGGGRGGGGGGGGGYDATQWHDGFGERGAALGRHRDTLTAEMAALVRQGPAASAQRHGPWGGSAGASEVGGAGPGGGGGGGASPDDMAPDAACDVAPMVCDTSQALAERMSQLRSNPQSAWPSQVEGL